MLIVFLANQTSDGIVSGYMNVKVLFNDVDVNGFRSSNRPFQVCFNVTLQFKVHSIL